LKAIETKYKGYRFRSRLEARWAVFLDQLGIGWEYEKEGIELSSGQRYLPDFWVPCPRYFSKESGYWLEIKATEPTENEQQKCFTLAKDTGHIVLLAYGSPTNEQFHKYSFDPVRENKSAIDVQVNHSKETSQEVAAFLKLVGNSPGEQLFFAHFEIATRFWFGQKNEDFDHQVYEAAIKAARAARFEHGERGV